MFSPQIFNTIILCTYIFKWEKIYVYLPKYYRNSKLLMSQSIQIYLLFTNSKIIAYWNKVISWDQWPCWNNWNSLMKRLTYPGSWRSRHYSITQLQLLNATNQYIIKKHETAYNYIVNRDNSTSFDKLKSSVCWW